MKVDSRIVFVVGLGLVIIFLALLRKRLPWLHKAVIFVWAVGPLIATLFGIIYLLEVGWIGWVAVFLFVGRWVLTGLGITAGFHRHLTHDAFKARPIVRFALLVLGCMAVQGTPIDWGSTHIKHHAYADREGDPHSPLEGIFHAHIGWFFKMPNPDRVKYGKHMLNDSLIVFVDRWTYAWVFIGFLVPYLIGGWQGLLWGGFIGMAFLNHSTFAVNSICHTFGFRTFETNDVSRNNWIIAILALGEGWHNNHHAFPSNPFHGMGRQFDLTNLLIKGLVKLGWVWIDPSLVPDAAKIEQHKQTLLRKKEARGSRFTT